MVNKLFIIEDFKKKIKEIKRHNNLYFNKDNPEITDTEFDNLKKEIVNLENKNKFLKDLKLFDGIIGSPPTNQFKKIKHLELN